MRLPWRTPVFLLASTLGSVLAPVALPRMVSALAANPATQELGSYVIPAPMMPDVPQTVGTDGGLSGTLTLTAGRCYRLSTSVDSTFRVGQLPDGGAADTNDNDLFAKQVDRECFTPSQSSLSVKLSAAGTFKAAPVFP